MLTLNVSGGDEVNSTIKVAIAKATQIEDVVQFEFNSVMVRVDAGSDPKLVYRDWERSLRGCTGKVIGPAYKQELSTAEKQHDAAVRATNAAQQKEQFDEMKDKDAARREKVDALIDDQEIQLVDAKGWEETRLANQDGYGGAAFRYADRFGRVMQVEIAKGMTVKDAVAKWEFECDDDGLTGFQQGCAMSLLRQCWKHGKELAKLREDSRA